MVELNIPWYGLRSVIVHLQYENIVLRDMKQSDVEDYVRWFTDKSLQWQKTDAPWEAVDTDEDTERSSWTDYYNSFKDLSESAERWRFEIEVEGRHIGWVSSYRDLDYIDNMENYRAVGIDICEASETDKGYGTKALKLFIGYYKSLGHKVLYTQTWSGNKRMLHVAGKLGFTEFYREKNFRTFEGCSYDAVTLVLKT